MLTLDVTEGDLSNATTIAIKVEDEDHTQPRTARRCGKTGGPHGAFDHRWERHQDGAFDHRWDRHPTEHNTRDHIHPGPDAPTPGTDASHPSDWRDVLASIVAEIETRQRGFWTDQE